MAKETIQTVESQSDSFMLFVDEQLSY